MTFPLRRLVINCLVCVFMLPALCFRPRQCPYTDPEKIKRYYDSKGDLIEELDEVDAEYIDTQLKKEEEELTKISTGIGKVFLKTVKEREKVRAYRRANIDPRNASRTPSAKTEIPVKLRYENPVNACKCGLEVFFQIDKL